MPKAASLPHRHVWHISLTCTGAGGRSYELYACAKCPVKMSIWEDGRVTRMLSNRLLYSSVRPGVYPLPGDEDRYEQYEARRQYRCP